MMKKGFVQVDLLHGSIFKSLLIFMVPIILSNAFQQLYNAVDTAIVANVLGDNALAAMGATASVFELLVGFSYSLGAGFSLVSARAFGAGQYDQLKKSVAGALVIGLVSTIVLTILAKIGLRPLLYLIHTPQEIFEDAYAYISVIGLWVGVMFTYNLLSGLLRAIGNSFMPLVFLMISSLLNIVLDVVLMTVIPMGIVGAAVATVISQGISVILCIIYMWQKAKILVPSRKHFHFDQALYIDLVGQGYSMAAMGSIVSCGSIILQSGINQLGKEIIGGHVAARKLFALGNLPFVSMGVSLATFVSQNRGANQIDRIILAIKQCYIYDIVAAIGLTIIFLLTGRNLIIWITGSHHPVILQNGSMYLYIVGPFYMVLGWLMQTRFSLQGLGSKMIPLISSGIEFVGKIIFTMIFIPMFGYIAVIFCEPIIWCLMTAQLVYSFYTNPLIQAERKKEYGA